MLRALVLTASLLALLVPPAWADGSWPRGEGFAYSPSGHVVTSVGGQVRAIAPDGTAGPAEGQHVPNATGGFVAIGDRGDAVALTGATLRYRPAGGRFGPPETFGADTDTGENFPAVAVDAAGTVIVAWTETVGDPLSVRIREPDGTWRPVQRLGSEGGFRPSLALSPNGTAVVAWQMGDRIALASRAPGADFGAPRIVAGKQHDTGEPVAAANDRGDAVVAWLQRHERPPRFRADFDWAFHIHGTLRLAGGDFGPSQQLSRIEAGSPTVAALPSGRLVLAWLDGTRVEARVRTEAGVLRRPRILTTDGSDVAPPEALPIGRGVVAYGERDRGVSHLRLNQTTELGGFGPPQPLMSAGGHAVQWRFAPSPAGVALVRGSDDELQRPPVVRRYALR